MKPKRCYLHGHAKGCRLSRPLCKWRRKLSDKYRVCECPAYHFPHRMNSGRCGNPSKMWEDVTKEIRHV